MTVRVSGVPASTPAGAAPTAPKSTLANERFMARLMRIERKKPLVPSSEPAMMSTLLSMAMPVAAAARPA